MHNAKLKAYPQLCRIRWVLGLETLAIMSVMEASATDISDTCVVQDARFHSLRAALDSLTEEKKNDGAVVILQGAHARGQSSITSASFAGKSRTARILRMQPDKFHLDGVSVAQHGIYSMNGVELQI